MIEKRKKVVSIFEKIAKDVRYNRKINPHGAYEEELSRRFRRHRSKN